ncbi:MAG: phosphatase PAP2 family protein [Bacteroidia bacterium]|nr:phosphatase PAP2 family protein [Bacteroidia bacterium]
MIKLICLIICIGVLLSNHGFCQAPDSASVYHVNLATVGAVIIIGSVLNVIAIKHLRKKPVITDEELAGLNREIILPMDRWALKQNLSHYKTISFISDYGQIPLILIPSFLMLEKTFKKDWLKLNAMYWEGHLITFFMYNYSWLGPRFRDRYRPKVYYDDLPLSERNIGYNRSSFYSGHVATVAFASFSMAKIYCDYTHPTDAKKTLLYGGASLITLAEGYLKVRALAHFPSDCLVGLVLGAAIGIITPEIYKINTH